MSVRGPFRVTITALALAVVLTLSLLTSTGEASGGSPHLLVKPTLSGKQVELDVSTRSDETVRIATWDHSRHEATRFRRLPAGKLLSTTKEDSTAVIVSVDKSGTVTGRSVAHVRAQTTSLKPTQWVAGDSGVSLSWSVPSGGGPVRWKVQRDHTLLGYTNETQFTDNTGNRQKAHTYTISGSQAVRTREGTGNRPIRYQVAVPPTDHSAIGKEWSDKLLRSPRANKDLEPPFPTKLHATVHWNSFIHEQFIEAPALCPETLAGVEWYAGDGRDFTWEPQDMGLVRSRLATQSVTTFNYGYPSDLNMFAPVVGTTIAYDEDFNEVARAQESSEGLKVVSSFEEANYGQRHIVMAGSDPLCAAGLAPEIDVDYTWRVTNYVDFSITAIHDKAPDHEAVYGTEYRYDPERDQSGCIYRFSNKGFHHLAGVTKAIMEVSFNPDLGSFPDCTVQ